MVLRSVFDLHITVDSSTLDRSRIRDPWRILDIKNVQGPPHCIVSMKYSGRTPQEELCGMVEALGRSGANIQREKIELHFHDHAVLGPLNGVVEIHYKYADRGIFAVTSEQIAELNGKKLAFSFNAATGRRIISARFENIAAYRHGKTPNILPPFLAEEEREVVVADTNAMLDAFWPMRIAADPPLAFSDFPQWVLRVP